MSHISILRALGVCLFVLAATAVAAEVEWRSGKRSVPQAMQPAELDQTIAQLASRTDARRVVIHLAGPLRPEQRNALEASGIRLLSSLGGNAYFANLIPDADTAAIVAAGMTVAVEAIDPVDKLHPDLARGIVHPWSVIPAATTAETPSDATVALYVTFHKDFDLEGAESVLRKYGATLRSPIRPINGAVAHLRMSRVAELAADDDVMYVEPPLPMLEELNDENSALTGADIVNNLPFGIQGEGVTVMVYDGGQVFAHEDLSGRLTIGLSDTDAISDHATHVACTIAGNGSSNTGMAPAASIVSYGYEQPGGLQQGFLYTDPGDLAADYGEAQSLHGADLSNNSIGSNVAQNGFPCEWEGNYGATGALIDEVVRGALGQPFRIVWANGNERGNGSCGTSYHTTGPPACNKNAMTVGALNADDDSVTSFTSWGPCDDGRLKPDIAAPGCQSNGDNGVTSCSSSGGYNVKCGTSMASPTAAGVSALVLQQFRDSFPTRPDFRNSLLRAVMAQTAVDLFNPGPDYRTGYGSIRAVPAVTLIQQERFVEDSVAQGQVYAFTVQVGGFGGADIAVTLAWDDPAGTPNVNPVLVNDLDLRIIGPDDTVYLPWTLDPDNPGEPAVQTAPDRINNIEQVRIEGAAPGTYIVEIEGYNVAEGLNQPFGVATSHPPAFCPDAPTFAGLQSLTPGPSCGEIDLSWNAATSNCTPAGQITYEIYRSTGPLTLPDPGSVIKQGHATTTFSDANLDPGVPYHYLVRARDSLGGEDANLVELSGAATASPDNSAPLFDGLQSVVAGANCGEVLLDWAAAIESCSQPVTYELHRSIDPAFVPGPGTLVAETFGTAFVDTSVQPGTQQTYVIRARDNSGNGESNLVRLDVTPTVFDLEIFRTDFEPDDQGWTVVAPNDSSTGEWEWGDPDGTNYQPDNDDSDPGVNCWMTGLGTGPSNGDIDDGTTTLLSAQYDATGMVNAAVSYSRWFTNDRGGSPGDPTDNLSVDVSNDDGQNWTSLELVGAGTPLSWVQVTHALPIAPTNEMRFRFSAADLGAGSLVEAGVDEFGLVDAGQACLQCSAPTGTLCEITTNRIGDDILVDWSSNPVGTRAVVYDIAGCGQQVKLATVEGNSFLHGGAALSADSYSYRVTFVDACGNEQAFCGATDCP